MVYGSESMGLPENHQTSSSSLIENDRLWVQYLVIFFALSRCWSCVRQQISAPSAPSYVCANYLSFVLQMVKSQHSCGDPLLLLPLLCENARRCSQHCLAVFRCIGPHFPILYMESCSRPKTTVMPWSGKETSAHEKSVSMACPVSSCGSGEGCKHWCFTSSITGHAGHATHYLYMSSNCSHIILEYSVNCVLCL